jgi:hypothetical protein
MTIASYSDMQDLIARRLKRSNLTNYIPDYIRLAEARIYRELRVRAMETALSDTIAAGVIAVPSGYVELKHARIAGNSPVPLQRKSDEWIYANYPTRSADGQPKFIAREASNFIFGPYPDSAYTVSGIFYKRLDALSDSNTSNWLITDAPDLLLFASLVEGFKDIRNDQEAEVHEGRYQQTKATVEVEDKNEGFGGSTLAVTAR